MTCNEMAFYPANFILQRTLQEDQPQPLPSFHPNILPYSTPQDLHGVASFLGKRSTTFSGIGGCHEEANINIGEDVVSDDGSQAVEKKRRLNMEQVKTLEKSFEVGNKLEPERKMQLARALGLQPRQIAIWFQNRRARWKTKQLEKDYDLLMRQYEAVKAKNDSLQAHNLKLHAEILALKSRNSTESINLNKETEGFSSNRSENSSAIKLDTSRSVPITIDSPMSNNQITTIPFFLSSSSYSSVRPNVAQVLFQANPSSSKHEHVQYQNQMVKEESLSNMFCGIDDHYGFWPLLEQHRFN